MPSEMTCFEVEVCLPTPVWGIKCYEPFPRATRKGGRPRIYMGDTRRAAIAGPERAAMGSNGSEDMFIGHPPQYCTADHTLANRPVVAVIAGPPAPTLGKLIFNFSPSCLLCHTFLGGRLVGS